MTTERWTDENLDRLADAVSQNSQDIRSLLTVMNRHQDNFDVMVAQMGRLQEAQGRLREDLISTINLVQGVVGEVRTIADEVRGLQTENRRIMDHLFGNNNEA
jgi:ABC-type transporter Mla subunit MlaD